jgi:diguanylate cyclase (GGDEF)-like protein/PAS domain S-box-containing protein
MIPIIDRVRRASTRSISTKYALLFALLVNVTVTVILVSAGMITFGQSEAVRYQVQEAVANSQQMAEDRELRRTSAYLIHRLRRPLARMDTRQLAGLIEEVNSWLPTSEFVVTDPSGMMVTDGNNETGRRSKKIDIADSLRAGTATTVIDDQGKRIQFAVLDGTRLLGYARLVLANSVSDSSSLESLDLRLYQVWNSYAAFLIGIGAIALALVLCLAVLLIFVLSRSLASPLHEMIAAARNFTEGNLDVELPIRSDDELGQLARSLNTMAAELKKKGSLLTRAQEIANLGSWEWEPAAKKLRWSMQALRIMGYRWSPDNPSLDRLFTHLSRSDARRLIQVLRSPVQGQAFDSDFRFHRNDGSVRLIRVHGQRNKEAEDGYIVWSGTLQDVTERQAAEDKLNYLANYDALTGLPNRHLFQNRLHHAIQHAQQHGTKLGLLFLDLDHFKGINDALGHSVGDEVLKLAAMRLRQTIRESDTVARLGGDEFTIILEHISDHPDVSVVAQRIVHALSESFTLAGERDLSTSCSVGITLYPDDGCDVTTLLKNADAAMYRSKADGRGHYCFYTPEMNREAQERLTLESQLRSAVRNREFTLHFQPQLDLNSGELLGAEALLRWRTELGLVPPDRFIPVLEESGMIQDLSAWIIATACRQLRTWREAGLPGLRVAVNMSARQFQQPDLPARISRILHDTEIDPDCLEIEITESVLLDPAAINPIARELVAMGVRLTIDDFGTGYCSLTYLKELSVNALKIDRSFVHDIPSDPDDCAISEAIINLSKSLSLEVIAEGVETDEQWAFLSGHGCNLMQGFIAAKPLAPSEFSAWVASECRCDGNRYFWSAAPPQQEQHPTGSPRAAEVRSLVRYAAV